MYVIGIDQGTTGTFVGLMNTDGEFVAHAYKPHKQIHPNPGWVEHDPMELWNNIVALVNAVIEEVGVPAEQIAGLGIANQGESVVMWDAATGDPLYNVIVWQDTRTQSAITPLMGDAATAAAIRERTGLQPDAYFSASKIAWLLKNVRHQDVCCGTLDSWFIWMMTRGAAYVTDPSTASRTLLYNIHSREWDDYLLNIFDIRRELLAAVKSTTGHFGEVRHPDLLCQGVPIVASIVDQPAAMVGHACLDAGQAKATYGTGCFINMNTQENAIESANGLLTLLAWERGGNPAYGLDGGVLTAGASINWLTNKLRLLQSPESVDALCDGLDDNPVTWVPAQIGLGPPYWNRDMRGAWFGIGLETEAAQLVHAVLEGIALRVVQILRGMVADSGLDVTRLRVDGGLTKSRVMMQLQADLLGLPVEVLADSEATGRGVCYLAAREAGLWAGDEVIRQHITIAQTFEPGIVESVRAARLERFERAVRAVQEFA